MSFTVREKLAEAYDAAEYCSSCEEDFTEDNRKTFPSFNNAYYGGDYGVICETCEGYRQDAWMERSV